MSFKKILFLFIFLSFAVTAFPAEKWNVFVAEWRDLSAKKNLTVSTTIKKSILGQLQKEKSFNVLTSSKTKFLISNFKDALDCGRTNKADVIVYGDYYIDREKLIVITEVYDALENRPKMRKYYSGEATVDIFDTIDAIASDMLSKIKEALPEMTQESEVRIKKVRESVYETEKVTFKRMFYSRIGTFSEFGPKNLTSISLSGSPFSTNNFKENAPFSSLSVGLALRLWDFRIDLMGSFLPGIPCFNWKDSSFYARDIVNSLMLVSFSYYLPWFDNAFAVGLGSHWVSSINRLEFQTTLNSQTTNYKSEGGRGFQMSFNLIWNPNPNLELSLYIMPFVMPYSEVSDEKDNNGTISGKSYKEFNYSIPPLYLSGIVFLGEFGLEGGFYIDSYKWHSWETDLNGNQKSYDYRAENTTIGVYLGIVYKVDFLNP
jgi:TolB-like protein